VEFEILSRRSSSSDKQRLEAFARAALGAMSVRTSDDVEAIVARAFDLAEAMMAESDERMP
jgi:hypothetical protein